MIENFKDSQEEFADYDSEMLLKILNNTSLETNKGVEKELFVDENWKINSKNMDDKIPSHNSNLKRILSDIFLNKKIMIQDNNNGRNQFSYPNLLSIKRLFIQFVQYLSF